MHKPVSNRRSEPDGNQSANRRSEGGGGQSSSRPSGRSSPPYNPGLQKLVDGKQAWSEPLDKDATARGFLRWHQRGYLPHYDAPGVTQLVTFRLHDAMPANRRSEWEAVLHLEDDRKRRQQLEEFKDDTHCAKAIHYIEANPVKVTLAREARDWSWSSARQRDEYGRLANRPKTADRSAGLKPALDERNSQGTQP